MITPKAHTTIAASPARVITFVADPDNAPRWMRALEVSEPITPGPIRVGSQFREIQSAGGQRIETICEVIEYDGETRYAWNSVDDGPARYGGAITAVPISGGTELRYEGWATTPIRWRSGKPPGRGRRNGRPRQNWRPSGLRLKTATDSDRLRLSASVDEAESFGILLNRVSAPHHAFPQES